VHAAKNKKILFNLFVVAKRVQMRVDQKGSNYVLNRGDTHRRMQAAIVAVFVVAGMHESGSVSASWRHASAHAGRLAGCEPATATVDASVAAGVQESGSVGMHRRMQVG
jgi:hypothetical protein